MTQVKMGSKEKRSARAETIRKAERMRDDLSAALRALGIVLPSLSVEPMAYADDNPDPLLDLGRCNRSTARKLLAVLSDRAEVSAVSQICCEASEVSEEGKESEVGTETDMK